MTIWNTIVITIKHAIIAALVFVGVNQPAQTVEEPKPLYGQVRITAMVPDQTFNPVKQKQKLIEPVESTPQEPTPTPSTEGGFPTPQPVVLPINIINPIPTMNEPVIAPPTEPVSGAPTQTIEIFNNPGSHGLGREFTANDYSTNPDGSIKTGHEPDDSNYVDFGIIVRDENGNVIKDAQVNVESTDSAQNKIIVGTGNMATIYVNGDKQVVPYYPFSYNFKTPGEHIIKFITDTGVSASVTLTAK